MSDAFDLIQVGELAVGFSEHVLPDSEDLKGKSIDLFFEDGSAINYVFHDKYSLTWKTDTESHKEEYRATNPRENILFVDFISAKDSATSISIILDFENNIATSLTGRLPDEAKAREDKLSRVENGLHQTGVEALFSHAAINKKFEADTPTHRKTNELIGKRVEYIYSQNDTYEHIYLNENLYTWHCLKGIEEGMADTDLCHYFKIAENLYFFVWREKFVPTLGVVIVNLEAMKTTGKIFGYESDDFNKRINFPVGAFASYSANG